MANSAKFWDRMAKGYHKSPVSDQISYQKKLDITQQYLTPDMNILEFGCGTGTTAIYHAPKVSHIDAIDISPNMIEIANQNATNANITNVTFTAQPIEGYTSNKPLDMVLGLSILHLLDDKQTAIQKIHTLLKDDGLFITSTICIGEKMGYLKFLTPVAKLFGLTISVFNPKQLRKSLTKAGFKIEQEWQPASGKAVFLVARKTA